MPTPCPQGRLRGENFKKKIKKVFLLAKAAGVAEEEDLKAGGRCSGHATRLQPRSRMSVGIIFLREIELLLVPDDDTSSSGPSTA